MSKITFGKYVGREFSETPSEYLEWMVREQTPQSSQAQEELDERIPDYDDEPHYHSWLDDMHDLL